MAPRELSPAIIGALMAPRRPSGRTAAAQRGQRVSLRRSSIMTSSRFAVAKRQGPSSISYCNESALRTRSSVEPEDRRPRASMIETPAPDEPGTVSLASALSTPSALSAVSSDSSRPDMRAKTAASSSVKGRSGLGWGSPLTVASFGRASLDRVLDRRRPPLLGAHPGVVANVGGGPATGQHTYANRASEQTAAP